MFDVALFMRKFSLTIQGFKSASAENRFLSVLAEFDTALLRGVGVNQCSSWGISNMNAVYH